MLFSLQQHHFVPELMFHLHFAKISIICQNHKGTFHTISELICKKVREKTNKILHGARMGAMGKGSMGCQFKGGKQGTGADWWMNPLLH